VRYAQATFLKRLLEDLFGGPSKLAERIQILEGVTRVQREKLRTLSSSATLTGAPAWGRSISRSSHLVLLRSVMGSLQTTS
jgi:hypothetical protein